jgi:hypothetical protein
MARPRTGFGRRLTRITVLVAVALLIAAWAASYRGAWVRRDAHDVSLGAPTHRSTYRRWWIASFGGRLWIGRDVKVAAVPTDLARVPPDWEQQRDGQRTMWHVGTRRRGSFPIGGGKLDAPLAMVLLGVDWRWHGSVKTGPVPPGQVYRGSYAVLSIGYWLPLAAIALALFWADARHWPARRRARAGLCPRCGYDLRATPRRCPECGFDVGPRQRRAPAAASA